MDTCDSCKAERELQSTAHSWDDPYMMLCADCYTIFLMPIEERNAAYDVMMTKRDACLTPALEATIRDMQTLERGLY